MLVSRIIIATALPILLAVSGQALGDEDPHAKHRAMMKSQQKTAAETADVDLRDHTLIDQDGQEVRFASDVIGDNIVVMDFVYTTCTTVCPVLSALFHQVQNRLGDRLDNDVVMVSLTVDPVRDTPQRLKAYSSKHRAAPGWVWLTGPKTTVEDVLVGVGAYSVNFEDHPSMVLVGDGRTGEWKRLFGFPSPDRIMQLVDEFEHSRAAGGG
jgi:protein SCO1/2